MSATSKVMRYQCRDVVRSRWLIAYALFFLAASDALLRFGGDATRALLSLMSVTLFVIPLVTVVFGTVYLYNAREFTELLLAQPVKRGQLFVGLYAGLALPLSMASAAGTALPFLLRGPAGLADAGTLVMLIAVGVALTAIFTALALVIAVKTDDRLKGLGAAIAVWLMASLVYDALVMLGLAVFADAPLEKPALALTLANPVDLARVLLVLRFDVSALMGYTGAVFHSFFGGALGIAIAAAALAIWIAAPVLLGARAFERKDF